MSFPWFLSMAVGFLSLSQEILWMRYFGFAEKSTPAAFSVVLMIYLLGIAAGALAGRVVCGRTRRLYAAAGTALLAAAVLDAAGPLLASLPGMRFLILPLIFLCAALKSVVFPVAHHLGSSTEAGRVGKSVSRVYFMNITGATLGPLLTGFVLLDHVTLQTAMAVMAVLTALLGLSCAMRETARPWREACVVAAVMAAFLLPQRLAVNLTCGWQTAGDVRRVVETKSGIIQSLYAAEKGAPDFTLGNNVYDGRTDINPRRDVNGLERAYVLASLQPAPRDVLVIGLSSGAWARILTGFPGVRHIEVVEINPGYLEIIKDYPDIAPFLSDPRVHVNIDDGRRWLKRNPERKFDLVVMNATYHWRSYSTNLLSREFLELVRGHLTPGAVITYNTTGSPDVLKTAESVFPFAYLYMNFVVAGNADFRPLQKSGRSRLLKIRLDGKPVFDPGNAEDEAFIARTLSLPFRTSVEERGTSGREGEIITDWNMIPEFKHGVGLLPPC